MLSDTTLKITFVCKKLELSNVVFLHDFSRCSKRQVKDTEQLLSFLWMYPNSVCPKPNLPSPRCRRPCLCLRSRLHYPPSCTALMLGGILHCSSFFTSCFQALLSPSLRSLPFRLLTVFCSFLWNSPQSQFMTIPSFQAAQAPNTDVNPASPSLPSSCLVHHQTMGAPHFQSLTIDLHFYHSHLGPTHLFSSLDFSFQQLLSWSSGHHSCLPIGQSFSISTLLTFGHR